MSAFQKIIHRIKEYFNLHCCQNSLSGLMGRPVSEKEWLYRRAWSKKNYVNPDGTATSRAFALRTNEIDLSVDVASMTTADKSIGDSGRFILFEIPNAEVL